MQAATIAYRNGRLEACERDDVWTVRLANLEARASYLDLALAELLGNALEAHRAAAKLLTELEEVAEHQDFAHSKAAPPPPRERVGPRHGRVWAKPPLIGLRVLVLAVVASAAFMLTTWLSAFR
jgi:plasmid stabilization system protein ParE